MLLKIQILYLIQAFKRRKFCGLFVLFTFFHPCDNFVILYPLEFSVMYLDFCVSLRKATQHLVNTAFLLLELPFSFLETSKNRFRK